MKSVSKQNMVCRTHGWGNYDPFMLGVDRLKKSSKSKSEKDSGFWVRAKHFLLSSVLWII